MVSFSGEASNTADPVSMRHADENGFMGRALLCRGNIVTAENKAVQHVLEDRVAHVRNPELVLEEDGCIPE
jgi:hypothetical protein